MASKYRVKNQDRFAATMLPVRSCSSLVPSAEDLNGLVKADGRQADLQRPPQPCRSDAKDHPLWRLSVVEHDLASSGDGVARCLAGTGLVFEHRSEPPPT
ncbi:hypothetical protein ACFXKG_40245 [Streptomyces sp. NPDC059255]|uniref:hypothetical protein n=1 Tax=Streptomyces sp. NPDC059255 TaxID=3346793 RepID=UPI0036967AA3